MHAKSASLINRIVPRGTKIKIIHKSLVDLRNIKSMNKFLLPVLLFLSQFCFGQATFSNQSILLGFPTTNSGAPLGISDMNNDNRDDIIFLDDTNSLIIFYQNSDNTFTKHIHGSISGSSWAMTIGDTNNDGYGDVVAGGAYDGVKHIKANGTGTYTTTTLSGPAIFVQGSALVDVNNDGFLDAMNCHDDGPSTIWVNDGSGQLDYSGTTLIDFNKFPTTEDNSGNYGITWTDFDLDGDTDLYISKCRLGAFSPTDPRRINQLWVNDGLNNYAESANKHKLDIGAQSWVTEFQDIDNDGDLDVFVGNHDVNSQLFENVDGKYEDITAASGIVASGGTLIQAAMKDMDNDGFVDLLISGRYFQNDGDKTFTEISSPFGSYHTMAIGDLNEDGFLDMVAGYGFGYNSPSNTADKLWINNRNSNHFLAVNLIGTVSNASAVGAVLELHGEWGVMIREVRAGESYGITHSFAQHFGLGSYYDIDKLVIKWPSGTESTYENILPNQTITIAETGCDPFNIELASSGRTTLCPSESVNLQIDIPTGASAVWSDGSTSNTITVSSAGDYNVTVTAQGGCQSVSRTIRIVEDAVACLDPCEDNYILHGTTSPATYRARNFIKSDGQVAQGSVEFDAAQFVAMEIGFEVSLNATFLADINGCN